ncbi:hypothetical protein V5735_07205 (plasmid) [Haladaptatus sp. SPP-AMP-3]|uniref:DUF7556 family protein n=1 Tax=Haladaptatus sp. SPP-AMP-3 TaxID=3121295 RepID=UPI003C2D62D0
MTHSALGRRRDGTDAPEIVFAIDETPDERCPNRAIIADITRDDAWIATDSTDTVVLTEWR